MNWRGKEAIMKHILAIVATLAATPAMAQNVIPPAEYDFPYKGEVRSGGQQVRTRSNPNVRHQHFPTISAVAADELMGSAIS
jgi:hypothetical protein